MPALTLTQWPLRTIAITCMMLSWTHWHCHQSLAFCVAEQVKLWQVWNTCSFSVFSPTPSWGNNFPPRDQLCFTFPAVVIWETCFLICSSVLSVLVYTLTNYVPSVSRMRLLSYEWLTWRIPAYGYSFLTRINVISKIWADIYSLQSLCQVIGCIKDGMHNRVCVLSGVLKIACHTVNNRS